MVSPCAFGLARQAAHCLSQAHLIALLAFFCCHLSVHAALVSACHLPCHLLHCSFQHISMEEGRDRMEGRGWTGACQPGVGHDCLCLPNVISSIPIPCPLPLLFCSDPSCLHVQWCPHFTRPYCVGRRRRHDRLAPCLPAFAHTFLPSPLHSTLFSWTC